MRGWLKRGLVCSILRVVVMTMSVGLELLSLRVMSSRSLCYNDDVKCCYDGMILRHTYLWWRFSESDKEVLFSVGFPEPQRTDR